MMTDQEISHALAEKVMGWHVGPSELWDGDAWFDSTGKMIASLDMSFLTDDGWNCAVLDRMAEQGRVIQVNYRDGCWDAWFSSDENMAGDWRSIERIRTPPQEGEPGDRRRSICLAVLKAVGCEVEGHELTEKAN